MPMCMEQAGTYTEEEVVRAKNQTKSAVLMNLEQRIVSVEDIGRQVREYSEVPFRCSASDFAPVTVQVDGRQVLTYGQRHTAAHVSANIDKVCDQPCALLSLPL